MTGLQDEVAPLGALAPVTLALVEYSKSLAGGADFVRRGRRWVARPNFVALEVHAARARHVTFTVYGFPSGYKKCRALPLHWTRSSYGEFLLKSPRQLAAAASYIATAFHFAQHKRKSKPMTGELQEIL